MHEPVSVRAMLRQVTHDAHGRVDALFADGIDGPPTYLAYLLGMRGFLAAAGALPGLDEPVGCLDRDLSVLGAAVPARPAAPAPARSPAARLGWRYVIDGSSHGARVLLRQALALGHTPVRGAAFLASHAAGARWPQTLRDLDAVSADPADRRELREGALAAFAAAHDALQGALATHRSATPA